jgi:hypothetical protein
MNTSANTNWDVTISGFGTPVAAMFFWSYNTADGTADERKIGMGAATGSSNQWAGSTVSGHGLTTTAAQSTFSTSSVVYGLTTGGSFYINVDFVSFITDGVRLHNNSTYPPPSAMYLTVVLIGGTDVSATAGALSCSTTLDGTASVSSLSFEPTDLICCHASSPNISFGVAHNGTSDVQYAVRHSDRSGVTTTAAGAASDDSYVAIHGTHAANQFSAEITAYSANGFTVTTRNSTTGTAAQLGYLALRISNFSSFAGRLTTPASTGNFGVADPGFKPQFVMQFLTNVDVDNTIDTTNKAGAIGVSVSDGSAQYTHAVATDDGVTTSNTESTADNVLSILHNDDGAARFESSFVSFDTNGFTQNFSATVSGALWPYWVVQEESGESSSVSPSVSPSASLSPSSSISQSPSVSPSASLSPSSSQSITPSSSVSASPSPSAGFGILTANCARDVNLHQTALSGWANGGVHNAVQFGSYNFGLMYFDISSIPSGSTVTRAYIRLGLYEGGGNGDIYAVLSANSGWIEGTGNLTQALSGEPCWNAKESTGSDTVQVAWAGGSNGCGVTGTDISSSTIGSFTLSGQPIGIYNVELSVSTVQNWIGGSNSNYGLLIKPTNSSSNHIALREYGTASYRPQLIVEYTTSGSSSVSPSISPSASASPSPSAIVGSVVWGHITGATEDNIRTFAGNWTGTGAISGTGNAEAVDLDSAEYMESEVVLTGAFSVTLLQNVYAAGDGASLFYRHGNSIAACQGASWNAYTVPFTSLGYVQVRIEA